MRKRKLGYLLLITLLLVTIPVGAAQVIDLDEAVEEALEKSLSLKASQLEVEDKRLALRQAEAENILKPSPAALLQTQRELEIASQEFLMERYDTAVSVEEAYYSVLKAMDYVNIGDKALDLSERFLKASRDRFVVGAGTQSEVMDWVKKLTEARADLVRARGAYDLALLNFRRTMGLPLQDSKVPKYEVPQFQEYLPDLEEDIEYALKKRIEVLKLEALLDAASTQVGISQNKYTPELVLARSRLAEERAENGLEQLRYGIELEIRQAHTSLVHLAHKVEAEQENVTVAEENLRIARRLFEADMVTEDQVMAAEVGLEQAQMSLRHTIYDYNLAKLKYDKVVACPLMGEKEVM
jgi:outer membrane protein TolC